MVEATTPADSLSGHTLAGNAADKFTPQRITWMHRWTDHLFSFRTTRDRGFRFTAGQFARLGVWRDDGTAEEKKGPRWVWRAYSVVSATYDEHLEFYSIVVPDGEFTTRLAQLRVGDELRIEKQSYGFMTLDRFVGGRDLWLLASGTGLAPFMSMLVAFEVWQQYQRVILVHSVRETNELAYRDEIAALRDHPVVGEHLAADAGRLRYVPIVTRQAAARVSDQATGQTQPRMLNARIPLLLENGALEQQAEVQMSLEHSRIMICGNPTMVDDIRTLLTARGYAVSRRAKPAQIAVENYW